MTYVPLTNSGVFGAYLLSVYDPETETYQTISKLGTGFSEEVSLHLISCGSGRTLAHLKRVLSAPSPCLPTPLLIPSPSDAPPHTGPAAAS